MTQDTKNIYQDKIKEVHDFWNGRPCNIRHSDMPQDSLEFFDEVAIKKYRIEPHKKEFLALEKWRGKNVLELGCGMGTDAIQFAKAGANVVCIDLTGNSLALCRKNFAVHGLTGQFFLGNIEELDKILPIEYTKFFDLIYSFGVIHHTPNPKKVFEKIPLFLDAGGEVRCMLYSRFSYKLFWVMKEQNQWDFANADDLIRTHSEAQTGCPVTYTYTFEEISDLLGEKYHVDMIWKDHIFKWDIPSYKQNIFIPDTPFQNVSDVYFKQLEKELGWHTMFIAHLV